MFTRRTLAALACLPLLFASSPALAKGAGTISFPPGFLWGAATAAHQVEGHMANGSGVAGYGVASNANPRYEVGSNAAGPSP